jgi:hypothetical protein
VAPELLSHHGGEMNIYETIGVAWVIFTSVTASIAFLYLAFIGLRTIMNKQNISDANVPVEVKEMFKMAR